MGIETTIRHFIIENFLFGEAASLVPDDESLMDHGITDSTGVLEILMFIEETFQISIDDRELTADNFDSIKGIAGLVNQKLIKLKEQAY
jgi:acyl carrier protein